jgi:CubicO group peptidase (beta-lactamase class C family)
VTGCIVLLWKEDGVYLKRIDSIIATAIKDGVFPGCVLGFVLPNGSRQVQAYGFDEFESSAQPMTEKTLFDVASVTKSIPVGTLALKRILEGHLSLETLVCELIPEFAPSFRNEVRVWHLLTHSLDYRFPMSSLKDLPPAQILERIFTHKFEARPGSLFNYGNASSLILGVLLERLEGRSLHQVAVSEFFEPLGMSDSGWFPLESHRLGQIAPTEVCPWRGQTMRGVVHDESAFAMRAYGPVGSAGLFSTVPDVLRFAQMMLGDGMFDEQRIMPAGVLSMVTENRLEHLAGQGTALGWELENRRFMGSVVSPRSFGKTGFTGTSIVCDPDRNAALVLFSNFTWPKREASVDRIYQVRRHLADAFFGALERVTA